MGRVWHWPVILVLVVADCSRTELLSSSPNARSSRVVLFGGGSNGSTFRDTWQWDGQTWTQLDDGSGVAPTARLAAAMAELGGRVVLFGGSENDQTVVGDTWVWDGAWHALDVAGPSPRAEAAMATLGHAIILTGGYDATGQPMHVLETWRWDGESWTNLNVASPGIVALAPYGDRLVGLALDYTTWFFDGTTWSTVATQSRPPDYGPLASDGSTVICVANAGPMSTTVFGDSDGAAFGWPELADGIPPSRSYFSLAPAGDGVILFGGVDSDFNYFGDTWAWRGDRWEQAATTGPAPRISAATSAW